MLGLAYLHEKDLVKGGALVDRILKRGQSAEAYLMMGMAKRAAQDLSGALEDLGKAVALNPELPSVHALFGRALLETGNRDRAQAAFEAELKRNPLDFDSHLYLGVLLREDANYDAAMAHFDKALGVRPGDPGVRYQIATIHVSRGESDRALPELEAIIKEAPSFVEAHVTLAVVYYRLKRRADGDRERAIVEELNKEIQAKQPGAVAPNRPPGG
jgi:tetratricopeptide (TPR) repeat protein